jgi:endo-1,4-beta-mannosidase
LLVDGDAAAAYTAIALEALRQGGCLGAMLWCYSDYSPALWKRPPLDLARHERTFGLWRVDGSPKPSIAAVAAFAGSERCDVAQTEPWIDIEGDEFWLDPAGQLRRLYRRYQAAVQDTEVGIAQLAQRGVEWG